MPSKQKTKIKYHLINKIEFLNLLKKEAVLKGATPKDTNTGWEIIGTKADDIYSHLTKNNSGVIRINLEGNEYLATDLLRIVSPFTLANNLRKTDFLSGEQLNLLLCLILGSGKYTTEEIANLLKHIKPEDYHCVDHFNVNSLVIYMLLESKSIIPRSRFWLNQLYIDGQLEPKLAFENSEITTVYNQKRTSFLNVLIRNINEKIDKKKPKKRTAIEQTIYDFNRQESSAINKLEYRDYYKLELEKLDFFQLLKHSNDFEEKVINHILDLVTKYFANYRFLKKTYGYSFFNKNSQINLEWSFLNDIKNTIKILYLNFSSVEQNNISSSAYNVKINHFGRIQEVIIPHIDICIDLESLICEIKGLCLGAYMALEEVYKKKSGEFYKRFSDTYENIRAIFDGSRKEYLKDEFRLLFAVGYPTNAVMYFFDVELINKLIKFLKRNRSGDLVGESPFDNLVELTTGIIPFDKSVGIKSFQSQKEEQLPWFKVPYWILVNNFAKIEKLSYGGKECVGFTPCFYKNYWFIVACDEENARHIMPEFKKHKKRFQEELEKTYEFYNSYLCKIKRNIELIAV